MASNGFLDPDDFSAWRAWDRTGSCDALTADGRDNGAVGYVEDQLEMGNAFSGQPFREYVAAFGDKSNVSIGE